MKEEDFKKFRQIVQSRRVVVYKTTEQLKDRETKKCTCTSLGAPCKVPFLTNSYSLSWVI